MKNLFLLLLFASCSLTQSNNTFQRDLLAWQAGYEERLCAVAPDCLEELITNDSLMYHLDWVAVNGDISATIRSMDTGLRQQIWNNVKGYEQAGHDAPKNEREFVTYSEAYIDFLKEYSATADGQFLSTYLQKHGMLKDISPSMLLYFNDKAVDFSKPLNRAVVTIHWLSVAYNQTFHLPPLGE